MSHGNLLIIDPEIAEPDRGRLRAAAKAGLLVPFRGPRPGQPPWPHDLRREWPSDAAVAAATAGAFSGLFGVAALAEWGISSANPFGGGILGGLWQHVRDLGRILLYPTVFVIALMSAITLICAVAATRGGWTRLAIIPDHHQWHLADAARRHYRRYATTADLDAAATALWRRTQIAARAIRESAVIRAKLVDAAQVTAALPYRMWEIAGKLARLSALRAQQRDILGGIPSADPDISFALDPQLTANQRAETDAEECVGRLEELARRLAEADAARRRAEAVHELRELTPGYHELLAGLGSVPGPRQSSDDPHSAGQPGEWRSGEWRPGEGQLSEGRLTTQAQAVIEQAREAVRQAEEAGLDLALPDDDCREAGDYREAGLA